MQNNTNPYRSEKFNKSIKNLGTKETINPVILLSIENVKEALNIVQHTAKLIEDSLRDSGGYYYHTDVDMEHHELFNHFREIKYRMNFIEEVTQVGKILYSPLEEKQEKEFKEPNLSDFA